MNNPIDLRLGHAGGIPIILLPELDLNAAVLTVEIQQQSILANLRVALLESPVAGILDVADPGNMLFIESITSSR